MEQQKKKNEGIVTLLLDALEKSVKKNLAEDVDNSGKRPATAEEIVSLTNAVKHLSDIVTHHNTAINELYLLQAHVLKQLKPSSADALSTGFGMTKKNNNEKPN